MNQQFLLIISLVWIVMTLEYINMFHCRISSMVGSACIKIWGKTLLGMFTTLLNLCQSFYGTKALSLSKKMEGKTALCIITCESPSWGKLIIIYKTLNKQMQQTDIIICISGKLFSFKSFLAFKSFLQTFEPVNMIIITIEEKKNAWEGE